jgi:hypothetical protein
MKSNTLNLEWNDNAFDTDLQVIPASPAIGSLKSCKADVMPDCKSPGDCEFSHRESTRKTIVPMVLEVAEPTIQE